MKYVIRDEEGKMLMRVSNQIAQHIISSTSGFFRSYKVIGKDEVTIFQIREDCVYETPIGNFYFWKNTKLIPEFF